MSSTPPPSDLSARRLAAVVASLHEAVLVEDATRRVQLANHAFCRIFGRIFGRIDGPDAVAGTDGRRIALELKTLFLNPDGFAAGIEAAIAAGVPRHGDLLPLADGRVLEREYLPLTGDDLPEASRHGHLWKYRDITARVREHARAETLSAVAAGLIKAHGADSTDSADSEEAMCEKVLQTLMTLGWQAGTVFLRAPQPVLLAGPRAAAPPQLTPAACRADQLSIERADQYRYLTHRAPFDADAGVIGDAWAHGRAHWLPDLAAAPACIRVDQARAIGLGTLVFVPIRAGHTSIGVLEVASTRTRAVDADVLRVLTEVGDRLGHVIERMRAHTQRGTQEAWTQTLLDRIAEGVMVIDGPSGEIVGANARAERMRGFEIGRAHV